MSMDLNLYPGFVSYLLPDLSEWLELSGFSVPSPASVLVILLPAFPGGSDGKEFACNVRDLCLVPGWGRSPGGGHGNPLQYSCLQNPMDRGTWRAIAHRVASRTRQWLSPAQLAIRWDGVITCPKVAWCIVETKKMFISFVLPLQLSIEYAKLCFYKCQDALLFTFFWSLQPSPFFHLGWAPAWLLLDAV